MRASAQPIALLVAAATAQAWPAPQGHRLIEASPEPRPPSPPTADRARPTLFLIGDSTVRNGRGDGANGQWGWGEPLASRFDPARIGLVNRALGGRSSRTYLTGGQWEAVRAQLRPGDFVLMQFGHNDGGPVNDTRRARGSLRGTGEETEEIENLLTKEHEVVHTYGWYVRRFIADTKAAGATPVVLSPVPRKIWRDGRIVRSQDYGRWAAEVARSEHVPFVDLNEIVARRYEALGPERVEPLFADEHTHTTRAGAEASAAALIEGLDALEGRPLSGYFAWPR
jgi:lysophospholipase L1-like esterase